jgi:hypothetical protein
MKARHTELDRTGSAWKFWAAVVCLVGWVLSIPGLVPVLACVIGGLDGQHEVSIAEGRNTTVVVLHHEGGFPKPHHQHSLLSGLLVAFSQSDRETQDHLLVFPRSEAAVSEDPLLRADAAVLEAPQVGEVRVSLLDLESDWLRESLLRTASPGVLWLRPPFGEHAARVLRI